MKDYVRFPGSALSSMIVGRGSKKRTHHTLHQDLRRAVQLGLWASQHVEATGATGVLAWLRKTACDRSCVGIGRSTFTLILFYLFVVVKTFPFRRRGSMTKAEVKLSARRPGKQLRCSSKS